MLQITEQTSQRLLLQDRAWGIGLAGMVFLLFSLVLMILMPAHNILLILVNGGMNPPVQIIALMMIMVIGSGFVWFGLPVCLTLLRGVTCTFDRENAVITLRRVERLRLVSTEYPFYGVSHTRIETNAETKTCAVYLVLRSGQQVLLTTAPLHDSELIEQITRQIRDFLRGG